MRPLTRCLAAALAVAVLTVPTASAAIPTTTTPSAESRALAQERYYSSYGRSAPLQQKHPARPTNDDGGDWPALVAAIAITGVVAAGAVALSRPRKRARRSRPTASR
jgi:hypothetical protein